MTLHVGICLAALSVGVCIGPAAVHAQTTSGRIATENARAGTTDWLLTQVEPVAVNVRDDRYQRQRSIEGYVLAHQHPRRRDAHGVRQHQPRRPLPRRRLPHGLVRRQGRATDDSPAAPTGRAAARTRRRREAADGGRWRPSFTLGDPRDLAERRLPRQADQRADRRSELRHLHRPRRPPGRPDVPVLRPHLAGLQPLARVAVALRLEAGTLAHDAGREGQLRPARTPSTTTCCRRRFSR